MQVNILNMKFTEWRERKAIATLVPSTKTESINGAAQTLRFLSINQSCWKIMISYTAAWLPSSVQYTVAAKFSKQRLHWYVIAIFLFKYFTCLLPCTDGEIKRSEKHRSQLSFSHNWLTSAPEELQQQNPKT